MIAGAAYGVALNDRNLLSSHQQAFAEAPYKAPPKAPVLYIKTRNCLTTGGAPVLTDLKAVQAAATIGVLFARDLTRASPGEVRAAIGAVCLALDVSEPSDSYYRPAIRQQCRDGFLPLGALTALPSTFEDIVTQIDGKEVHRWSLDRLVRPLETAASEISAFMTLQAGDLLLLGLAADAPTAQPGQTVTVSSRGLPVLTTAIVPEAGR